MMSFENHIAIITGSAQGFGKEFAVRLLQKGGKVCISDVNVDLGLQTVLYYKNFTDKIGLHFISKYSEVPNM